jgi:hypothetical protein
MKDGEPLSFTAKVEIRPKLDKIELEGLEIMRASVEVKDADVDAEVERLRNENATIGTPSPARAAKTGDVLTIDYLVAIDGEGKADMSATDRQSSLALIACYRSSNKASLAPTSAIRRPSSSRLPTTTGTKICAVKRPSSKSASKT